MRNQARCRSLPLAALLIASLSLTACAGSRFGDGSPSASVEPSASTAASAAPSQDASQPASAPTSVEPSPQPEPTYNLGPFVCDFPIEERGTPMHAQLVDVRVGEHSGFDRIVFEFEDGIPEYVLSEATPPYVEDPSGLPVDVDGEAVWQLVMTGGTRLTPEYEESYNGPLEFEPSFDKLVHLVEAGDFEALSTWYIGMSDESCARILVLDDPSRLVIDIQH